MSAGGRLLGCGLLVTIFLVACTGSGSEGPPDPDDPANGTSDAAPNVLIIVTDDQRAEGTLDVMPTLRRLFEEEGTSFTNAVATTPLCCPSRAGIFTGQYSHNHGVTRNNKGPEMDERSALPHYLQEAGYRTALVGKYLQGILGIKRPPNFDDFTISGGLKYYERPTNVDGKQRIIARHATDFMGDMAARYIRRFEERDDQPWFLYVAPNAPHKPFEPETKYAEAEVPAFEPDEAALETDVSDKPPYVTDTDFTLGDPQTVWTQQLRLLMSVDDLVGKIFRAIEAGDEENTLAFYMSDNGLMLGEHGLFAKRVPYHQSVAIPLLARWPNHIEAGAEDDRMVANIDLAPTIMGAAGIEPSAEFPIDGRSLLSDARRDRILLEEYENTVHGLPDWASILSNSYQFTEYYEKGTGDLMYREYYDLESDPFALENLLGDDDPDNDPDLQSLGEDLDAIRSCVGAECP